MRLGQKSCAFALVGLLAGCFDPADSELETDGQDSSGSATTTGGGTDSASTTGPTTGDTSNTGASTTAPTTTDGSTSTTDSTTTAGTTDSTTESSTTAGEPICEGDDVCVPPFSIDWVGPVTLEETCPTEYPTLETQANAGFVEGVYQCGCNCGVGNVSCQLWLENSDEAFTPQMSCDTPPFDDECLAADVSASCIENAIDVPGEPAWNQTRSVCTGALSQGACGVDGTCYPNAQAGLCIARDGEHDCPAGFSDRTVYYQSFTDTRECSACSCSATGQACTIETEICSIGFFDVTLQSGQPCFQLNSGDGDGVTLLSTNIDEQGSCAANGGAGELSGAAAEAEPLTVCCLE